MLTRDEKKAAIEAAYDFVHTDIEQLHRQCTSEHGIINMGQEVMDHFPYGTPDPGRLFQQAWSNFYQSSESDEMAEGLEAERKFFNKDVTRDIKLVQKEGLPLTVRNCRAAFLYEGPFKKYAKKAKKR